jgi:hypothetical protein
MKEYRYVHLLVVLKDLIHHLRGVFHETPLNNAGDLSFRTYKRMQSITQRLENLVVAHERLMNLRLDELFKSSFIRLQRQQFEYLSCEIASVLRCVMTVAKTDIQSDTGEFQMNSELVSDLVRKIKEELNPNVPAISPILPPLTKLQISLCRKIYSHPIEFLVMDRFLNRTPENNPELLFGEKLRSAPDESQDHGSL